MEGLATLIVVVALDGSIAAIAGALRAAIGRTRSARLICPEAAWGRR